MGRVEVDVLLVGGGVASVRCARTLRRNGFSGSVLIIGEEAAPPYNRPPLSKEVLRGASEELLAAEPARWYERHSVELLTGLTVTRLEPDERRATLGDGRTVTFGKCLLATGAAPTRLPVPGGELALALRTAADARGIREAALAAPGATVVVVGGGLIGVEVASALTTLGLRPTIVELTRSLWGGAMGERLAEWAAARLAEEGVEVLLGEAVTALDADAAWIGERRLPAAFVVAGVGVRPRDKLAAEAGIAVARGVSVGPDQRTSHARVWAAGDATRLNGRATEHWHAAREAGERAALSMLGMELPATRAAWTFTEVAGVAVDAFGEADPADAEMWIIEGSVIARTRRDEVTQLIVIGSSIPAEAGRRLVDDGVRLGELRERLSEASPG